MFKSIKKWAALALCLCMTAGTAMSLAESGQPPEKPQAPADGFTGNMPGQPPEGAPGQPPEGMPGQPPEGGMGGPGGMPGGGSSKPESYDAVNTYDSDTSVTGETIASTGTDENAVWVTGGDVSLQDAVITRESADSTGGDSASFYGVGAAVLATGGVVTVDGSEITTDAKGGAGVFAYGDGTAVVRDTVIQTRQDTSGGIHVAGGGTLLASNLTVTTQGGSSAAIRSDRGSGTIIVDGGSYTSNGSGSPAVYVTADITVHSADLVANGSEALCLEGLNTVRLYDCVLTGSMPDQEQNDNTWTVILYQSMSGDAEEGKGRFEMVGGGLVSTNGGLFYTTNTESEFVLSGVAVESAEDCEYFLRCTGNMNARGWGRTGENGADCTFTGIAQEMKGDVIWDSVSQLDLYLTEDSVLTGAVLDDESCAGEGGDGTCTLVIDETSSWVVTGDSVLTRLCCQGTIADDAGLSVTIKTPDGTVIAAGESPYTITVTDYEVAVDLSGAGVAGEWSGMTI